MLRYISFLIMMAFVGFSAPASAADPRIAKMEAAVAAHPDFSGVVLVAENGKPIFQHAAGFRNYAAEKAMTADAIFELASVSKQFTAMAIMLLKEEGKL